jgi:hypothetical protein
MQAEASAGGDEEVAIVERIGEFRQAGIAVLDDAERIGPSFSSHYTKSTKGETMKKIAFVLAAMAAIAFALPVTTAQAGGMHHHQHHHHHHHWPHHH